MKSCRYQLTATAAANTRPRESGYKVRDGGGMYLWVSPTGAKSWRYDYKLFGSNRTHTLGSYPETTLANARAFHQKARETVSRGEHPIDLRKQIQSQKAAETKSTFMSLALQWHDSRSANLAANTQKQILRELRRNLFPRIGLRPMAAIKRAELAELLLDLDGRAREVARNCRSYVSSIFEFAIDRGVVSVDPTPPRRILRPRQQQPHLAARAEDMGKILRRLSDGGHNRSTEIALRLLALTLLRKSEVVGAEWSEIDMQMGVWRVPKSRKKERRDFVVRLPRQAVLLIRELRELSAGRYLFPHRDDPERHMATRSLNALLERNGLNQITKVHGLRSTASTFLNERDIHNSELVEYALAHVVGSGVKRVYDRGDREAQRAELLQSWADYVESLEKLE